MKTYKILRTRTGICKVFGLTLLLGIVLMVIIIPILIINFNWFIILFLLYLNRLIFYSLIDFLFVKEFIETDLGQFIKISRIKLKIDNNRCYTVIEQTPIPGRNGIKHYYLVLVRNDKNTWFRIFKNKIKLYTEDGNLDLEGIGEEISGRFNIQFRGIDKRSSGEGYSSNDNDLMGNNGYIPG